MLKALHIGLIIIIITIIHEQSCRFKTLSVRASSNAFISSLALNADFIPKSSLNLYVFFYIFDNLLYVLCEKKIYHQRTKGLQIHTIILDVHTQ